MTVLRAFGLAVRSRDVELPGARPDEGPADVELRLVAAAQVQDAFSGPCDPPRTAQRRVDGRAVRYERGSAGDVRIAWEGAGAFHLAGDGSVVLASADGEPDAAWTRFVLDSVLSSLALHRGAEALHAAGAALPDAGGAVAIAAGQGGGKTTLLGALLARGAQLVADDVCVVHRSGDGFAVAPAPPVLNVARHAAPGAPGAEDLGDVLAELDDELWVRARTAATEPVALRAVVRLDRRLGARLQLVRPSVSAVALLGHVMDSGPDPARQARRFELVSDLAIAVPFAVLEAPLDTPPAELAETLLVWAGTGWR